MDFARIRMHALPVDTHVQRPPQPPEGALLSRALRSRTPRMSARTAARLADISEARWRQIVAGYASAGHGQYVAVKAPPDTLARMARVVDVPPTQLEEAGRPDAAAALRGMLAGGAEGMSTTERLDHMREEVKQLRYATDREKRMILAIIDAERESLVTRTDDEDPDSRRRRLLRGKL